MAGYISNITTNTAECTLYSPCCREASHGHLWESDSKLQEVNETVTNNRGGKELNIFPTKMADHRTKMQGLVMRYSHFNWGWGNVHMLCPLDINIIKSVHCWALACWRTAVCTRTAVSSAVYIYWLVCVYILKSHDMIRKTGALSHHKIMEQHAQRSILNLPVTAIESWISAAECTGQLN